jgi:integrase
MGRRKKARYGSGSIFQRGRTFTIKWWENGRQRTKGGFASRELAEVALAAQIAKLDRRMAGLGEDPKTIPPLGQLAEAWIEQRMNDGLHRSARDDKNRWNAYWKPYVANLKPYEVDTATITRVVKMLLAKHELAPNTVANALRMLSTFYSDLVEEGRAEINPVRMLPKKTRKLVKRANVDEPFVEKLKDVARLITALQDSELQVSVAYAIGALAGLRTGEILALRWDDLDLDRRILHVRRQVRHGKLGPVKDGDEREVGVQQDLLPILAAWRLRTGAEGQLFRPVNPERGGTKDTPATHLASRTLTKHLHGALKRMKLVLRDASGGESYLTWYQATRHTFASHYMMAGGDLAKLQAELGHSDIQTTQRYAKLSPDFRTSKDFSLIKLPKLGKGKVVALPTEVGSKLVANTAKRKTKREASASLH